MAVRNIWLDAAKGVGILLVVAAHVAGEGPQQRDIIFANAVFLFHMPLFFVISGYVYKPRDRQQLFWKKSASLAVPYISFLMVLTIAVVARRMLLGDPPAHWELRAMAINEILGGMRLGRDFGVFWFVTCLFFTQLIYNDVARWAKNPGSRRMLAFVGFSMISGYLIQAVLPLNQSPWALAAVPMALCCFWFGDLLRTFQFSRRIRWTFIAAVMALALIAWTSGADIQFNMKYSIFGPPVVGLLIALGLSLAVLDLVREAAKIEKLAAPVAKLGEASLVIMFLHQFFQFSFRDFGITNELVIMLAAVSGPLLIYQFLRRSALLAPWFLGTGDGAPGRLINWLRNGLGWRIRNYREWLFELAKPYVAHLLIAVRWPLRRKGRPHGLPSDLVVSLTSYPARFPTLHLTLRCLLSQTIAPDRVILWVTLEDAKHLPKSVNELKLHGLEIRFCKDIRSYKKIVPALLAFPAAYIVTADDDVYYSKRWLEQLVEKAGERTVVCHRGHAVALNERGRIEPYSEWSFDVAGQSEMLFPTGVGGVLYGPKSLSPEATDEETFTSLCPQGDDIWLFWMGRRAGSTYVKTLNHWTELSWRGSQTSALHLTNVGTGRNDEQIRKITERYGLPAFAPLSSDKIRRLPFTAEEMIARIQKALDAKGLLTAEESRSLWTKASQTKPD